MTLRLLHLSAVAIRRGAGCPASSPTSRPEWARPRSSESSSAIIHVFDDGTGLTTMPVVVFKAPAKPIDEDFYGELLRALAVPRASHPSKRAARDGSGEYDGVDKDALSTPCGALHGRDRGSKIRNLSE